MKKNMNILFLLLTLTLMAGCTSAEDTSNTVAETESHKEAAVEENKNNAKEETVTTAPEETAAQPNNDLFSGYKLIEVDGGDLSGHREPNVVVDIGYGDREYWAFTNEYGQLVRVIAEEIILQDDSSEPVLSSGRYYRDEAKVPGVESETLDEGHIIADSLGGDRILFEQNIKILLYII